MSVMPPALSTAPTLARNTSATPRGVSLEVRRAAEEFEGVFISQILGQMGASFGVPAAGDGGGGEDPFASMLRDEYAKVISRSGGIGVADAVMRELLRAQGDA